MIKKNFAKTAQSGLPKPTIQSRTAQRSPAGAGGASTLSAMDCIAL
jgi:hypothetical protein